MSSKIAVETRLAPNAIGCYSQAVRVDRHVYISGQLGINPESGGLALDVVAQIEQVFHNLQAIAHASGASLNDAVKLTVFLKDMAYFPQVNQIMGQFFLPPYPARAAVGVNELPKGADIEVDAILILPETV